MDNFEDGKRLGCCQQRRVDLVEDLGQLALRREDGNEAEGAQSACCPEEEAGEIEEGEVEAGGGGDGRRFFGGHFGGRIGLRIDDIPLGWSKHCC